MQARRMLVEIITDKVIRLQVVVLVGGGFMQHSTCAAGIPDVTGQLHCVGAHRPFTCDVQAGQQLVQGPSACRSTLPDS
jgi:hypothetical protein